MGVNKSPAAVDLLCYNTAMNDELTQATEEDVFTPGFFNQKRATKKLIDESRADADFYLLLSCAALITALGLLMDNAIVIVGAMLVAPILFPILALGLGVVTDSRDAIWRALKILVKTVFVGVGIAAVTSFIFGISTLVEHEQLTLLTNPDLLSYFFISFAAGLVASYAWVSEETAMTLPGVAISVSLVPPLAAIGVSLALLSEDLLIGSILLFLINLLGVVLASVVIFSLFHFNKVRAYQDKKIEEEKEGDEKDKDAEADKDQGGERKVSDGT